MKKYFNWILKSNRPIHILIGFAIGCVFGICAVFTASVSAEIKDWLWNGKQGGIFGWLKGNGFDWLDMLATMIGGCIGILFMYIITGKVCLI